MDISKEQKIIDILLTPIKCTEKSHGTPKICLRNAIIESTQTYYSTYLDEDMSDFSIGFYEILYRELLGEKQILNASGMLNDCCFAGDTMNSFHSIANITPGAGKSKNTRTMPYCWPEELHEYKENYHCLANFWLIPTCIGRMSKKLNYYDSMDMFLERIIANYQSVFKQHTSYYNQIGNPQSFFETHFIASYSVNEKISYCEENAFKLIEQATKRMQQRAVDLAKSKYANDLWDYFNELGLTDN